MHKIIYTYNARLNIPVYYQYALVVPLKEIYIFIYLFIYLDWQAKWTGASVLEKLVQTVTGTYLLKARAEDIPGIKNLPK